MKKLSSLVLAVLLALALAGCGGEPPATTPAPLPDPPAGEQAAGAESADAAGASRTWSKEEVLELFEASREKSWEAAACVPFYDQASGLAGAVLFQNGDTGTACVAFLGADGSCRMGGTDAQLASEPALEYLGDGAVSFKTVGEDGDARDHRMSITIEDVNVTFKSVDEPVK
ncbi:MAG TPA: hypothetical protein H9795_08235 [Candidatus Fournierella merdigallinarum]|nr:hypothetical protein [Candidatus Fournierella merdigallinarum]